MSLSGTVLSLSSPPAQKERSVSLAHAGKANPTYGEHVCSCAALSATRGLQVDLCYKRPSVCSEIISAASIQSTVVPVTAIACYKWGDGCCWTETVDETYLRTSFGPRCRSECGGKKKAEVRSQTLLRVAMQLSFSFSRSDMHDLTICRSPHSQSTRKCI